LHRIAETTLVAAVIEREDAHHLHYYGAMTGLQYPVGRPAAFLVLFSTHFLKVI
jgi:hypothetical protein